MKLGIPFNRGLFWKMFALVLTITALTFLVSVKFFDYEMTKADSLCSPLAAALLAYFLHLMLWNPEKEGDNN